MRREKTDEEQASSLSILVLWLALAAFVAALMIGVFAVLNIHPSLPYELWPKPAPETRIAP